MNYKEYLKNKLSKYDKNNIVITSHALIRLSQRQINPEEVIENILNPKRLNYAIRLESNINEEKFDCYFGYTKNLCHRYILAIKNNIIIITIIKINKKWQRIAERKLKNVKKI
jgi:hypothetical protein